jgi:hypothetical protein
MFAYALIHFGSNIKYLEYEIYTIMMLKKISKYDIIYLYSCVDTPKSFVKVIKKLNVKTKSFDDSVIINASKSYKSVYSHFNTLRTCCFIYANLLTKYKKVCIIESDIIFYDGFDSIFKLKTPSASLYNEQFKRENLLKVCKTGSPANGGVILLTPNKNILKDFHRNFNIILSNNCIYPNEILFVMLYDKIYNLPNEYNWRKFGNKSKIIYGHHFDTTIYKPVDIIKDNYIRKIKSKIEKQSIIYFKTKFYDKYNVLITQVLNKVLKFI